MNDELIEHPLLQRLRPSEQRAVTALCEIVEVPAGELLLEQGARTAGLYLLLEGRLGVTVQVGDGRHDVGVLGEGSVVGELSLLEDEEQSAADVRAATPARLALVRREHAQDLLAIDAVTLQLDAIARRRRAINRALRVPPVHAGRVDGRELLLRPLWPEDWRQYSESSVRVSDESLRMRFFHLPPLTERTFRRLTRIDLTAQFAWGAFVGDQLIGVGRYALQAEDRREAELAVLVADDYQGMGVATRLVTALVAAADAHGATELIAIARAENEPVRRLLGRFGAAFHDGEENGSVRAQWPVADALAAAADPVLTASAHAVAAAVLGDVLDR